MKPIVLEAFREDFNRNYSEEKYAAFLKDVHPFYDPVIDFRIAETPVFVSREFQHEMNGLFREVNQFIARPGLPELVKNAVPPHLQVPGENSHPYFMAIDFAVCQQEDGRLYPQLIELQGIASIYCYQRRLAQAYRRHYQLNDALSEFLPDMDDEGYLATLRRILVAGEDPEQVILLDILPESQKTRIDFYYTERDLGIKPVCITRLRSRGRQLFYVENGREIPVKRIYNRIVPDELEKKLPQLNLQFSWLGEYDVEWCAHPNWFFKISKYLLPHMDSSYVPKSWFLNQIETFPENLEDYVLKPLFSFAGTGLHFNVTRPVIDSIAHPENYILQRKVQYAPFLPTLDVPAKVEIRMLCTWEDELKPLMHLARLSKGQIMGVDFNKDKTWVGSSAVFFE